jgi:DNA-binding NarL/FixJ family response regulator
MVGTATIASHIFIVDENHALCRGYSAILGDLGLSTTACINCTTDCIHKLQALSNAEDGLVIVGPNPDEREVFQLFRWLHRERPNIKTILISRQASDRDFCLDVAANHVKACLPHTARCEDIAQAILDVLAGKLLFSSDVLEQAFQPIELSPRERDVLGLMAEGKTYMLIAEALSLSCKTVDNHRHKIFKKLNVTSKEAAVARAYRRGLL